MITLTRSFCFGAARHIAVLCCAGIALVASSSRAATGDVVAQYEFAAAAMVQHPTEPHIYATIPGAEFPRHY